MVDAVMVSGLESDFVAFKAPSGQWQIDLDAYLVSMGATFGFNLTPHKFSLQFIPTEFNGASGQLPAIGTYTTYEVRQGSCSQGFLIAGNVIHADYQNGMNGTVVKVELEDRRKDILDVVTLSTEDLGGDTPSGVISVGEVYRLQTGFNDVGGNISDVRVKEYRNISELGATYQQIWEAIEWGSTNGQVEFNVSGIPHPDVVATQMLSSTEPLRWKFSASPLSQVIATVLNDTSFDWYWGMQDDAVKVVSRKVTFDVNEDSLAVQQLTPDSVTFNFGADKVQAPSKVTLFGAHQEGFLNSNLLGSLDGIDAPAGVDFTFSPAWGNINVSFIDAFGIWRTYKPSEKELQMAQKSIEHWTFFKLYQTTAAPDGWGMAADEGTIAAGHTTFQSRIDPQMPLADFYNNALSGLRIITNRVDREHNWVLEWYAKIQNHAGSHYGRTYALSGVAFNENEGEYKVLGAAWCNIENQRADASQPFGENYDIHNQYAPIAPFLTQDFKVQAHCVLPSSTIYGPEGFSVPASFADWNEDAHPSGAQTYDHYIPVNIQRVGQNVINPRAEGNAFEDYPEGTLIAQLPILAGTGIFTDAVLGSVVTLFEAGAASSQSGIIDALNPKELVGAWPTLSGVAIPVQIRHRYGQVWPALWTSGTGSGTRDKVIVSDNFAPWQYFPQNQKTSVDIMSERASGFIDAQLVEVTESRFANLDKIDWPIISFDGFANQNLVSGIYGRRDHGVTDINVSFQNGVPTTKYGIKSFFSEFGKEAPLGERNAGILNGIIHPIDFTDFRATEPGRPAPVTTNFGLPTPGFNAEIGPTKETYAVTITSVTNRGSATEPETYFSETKDGIAKPGGVIDPLDELDLTCRDGFLNVGDHCLYHVEYKQNGQRRRYYSGGTDLTTGAGLASVSALNASTVDISYRGFSLTDVPTIGKTFSDIVVNEQGVLITDGTMKADNEVNITGLRPERDVPAGVYFQPSSGSATSTSEATPVIINEIASFGTASATATVQPIIESGAQGQFVGSGTITTGVEIIPIPQFAQSGDIGVLTQNAAATPDKFVYINRQAFAVFGA
jgi:hypothetical protein